jgi:hypothetical protein
MMLNYLIACCHSADWLVAVMPHAADWTLGLSARSAQAANEAYRVRDTSYFNSLPPELAASKLYESPDASVHFMSSLYFSQREKLERIPLKGAERIENYAAAAADQQAGPTLADVLAPIAHDEAGSFSDFPMPLRPVYDLLAELQLVTEYPTLLAVDGYNRLDQMATSCAWRTKRPLHASSLLVPSLVGDLRTYGAGMVNGLMLCATTQSNATPVNVPRALRTSVAPPHRYERPHSLPAELRALLRHVGPYTGEEVQAALEFYGLAGHMQNRNLEPQLRSGELATKARDRALIF